METEPKIQDSLDTNEKVIDLDPTVEGEERRTNEYFERVGKIESKMSEHFKLNILEFHPNCEEAKNILREISENEQEFYSLTEDEIKKDGYYYYAVQDTMNERVAIFSNHSDHKPISPERASSVDFGGKWKSEKVIWHIDARLSHIKRAAFKDYFDKK